jgi:hypothetical protein
MVALVKVILLKSVKAIVPVELGVTFVSLFVEVAPGGPPEV